jgi:PAS domain S-box-containing protein
VLPDPGNALHAQSLNGLKGMNVMLERNKQIDSNYLKILDSVDALIYVADMENHKLLFLNPIARERAGVQLGDHFSKMWQPGQTPNSKVCYNSQLLNADGDPGPPVIWEIQDGISNEWWESRAQAIHWTHSRLARLEIATNITERKLKELELSIDQERLNHSLQSSSMGTWDRNLKTQEISKRKQMEESLRASESRYRSFFENSLVGIFTSSPEGRYLNCNEAFATMLGFDSAQQLLETLGDIGTLYICPEDRDRYRAGLKPLDFTSNFIHEIRHRNGDHLWLLSNSRIIHNDDGEISHYEGICIDITLMVMAQNAVKASEENLQITLDSIGDAVISTDIQCRIERMNPIAEALTGWSRTEAIGEPLDKVFPAQSSKTNETPATYIYKTMSSGDIIRFPDNTELITRDGQRAHISVSTSPIRDADGTISGAVLIFRDCTEEHCMHEQLQRVQQLEQIGTLAGGIAHDFNNILSGIYGNLELVTELIPAGHPASRFLDQAKSSAERASNLTGQLLTFAKGGEPIKGAVDLGSMIQDIARFDLSGSKVKLVFSQSPGLHPVEVDGTQMQQVISNLVINAAQAMPDGGHLYIDLDNYHQEPHQASDIEAGDYIQISLRDEGNGIEDELLSRIFDPYFSTKQTGRGLGLATVHSVIARHNGQIKVSSEKGAGTSFSIYLPAAELPEAQQQQSTAGEMQEQFHRDLNILLMDDEAIVRETATGMLSFLGHRPQTAADGEEALKLYGEARKNGTPFDLVILDLTIPGGMGGQETLQELLAENPEIRAIVSSGYADDPIMAYSSAFGFQSIAQKPYSLAQLKQSISQAMQ